MTRKLLVLAFLIPACGGGSQSQPESATQPPAVPAAEPPPPVATAENKPAEPPKEAAAKPAAGPTPVLRYTEGISTPESVLYDEAGDRYLVSNINGGPTDVDNNGYIAELLPDGKVKNPKFIAGGANKVKLDAPKGMAISKDVLYVSDISVVRKFDAKTGAPKGDIPIAGATFLNDIAAAPDGRIYVTDSGVKAGKDGFEPTGTDAVYIIDKGKVKPLAKSKDLNGPNGMLVTDKGVLVVTLRSNELFRLDDKGAKQDVTKIPEGGLDGLAALGDSLLVSSWNSSSIYRGKLGDKFEVVVSNVKSPADIGVDTKRSRVLVPHFTENTVEAFEIK